MINTCAYCHQVLRVIAVLVEKGMSLLMMEYTAIFLTNGLCIVYSSQMHYLTLVYPGWDQKSEVFCLQVTTRRLLGGTVVGYRSTTAAYCKYTAVKGHWSTPG